MYRIIVVVVLACSSLSASAATLKDSNEIFDWAEARYPQFFSPSAAQTFEFAGYWVRYYPSTDNYLGTKDGTVYVYGDVFGGLAPVISVAGALNLARSDPRYPQRIDIIDRWNVAIRSTACGNRSWPGVIEWNYLNNTYNYFVTANNLIDPQTCQSYGPLDCDDYDFPFAGDPISEQEFTAGMNDGICTNDVYWQSTNFVSGDSIVIVGTYSDATVTIELTRAN